jgi:hypothetical protein
MKIEELVGCELARETEVLGENLTKLNFSIVNPTRSGTKHSLLRWEAGD